MPDVVFPNDGDGGGPRMMLATHNNQILNGRRGRKMAQMDYQTNE
jgi:hypothetical protein